MTLKPRKPIGFIQPKDEEEKDEEKKDYSQITKYPVVMTASFVFS